MITITPEIIGITNANTIKALNDALRPTITPLNVYRLANFLSQIKAESNFKPLSENMSYSKSRMRVIFGRNGRRGRLYSNPSYYARNPKNLADYVYANRMGNGNTSSGDGYRYRGRGLIQLTGKYNYKMISKEHQRIYGEFIDFAENPDLLLDIKYASKTAVCFWEKNKINKAIDKGYSVREVTKIVNGGSHGLKKRRKYFNQYLEQISSSGFTINELIAINSII